MENIKFIKVLYIISLCFVLLFSFCLLSNLETKKEVNDTYAQGDMTKECDSLINKQNNLLKESKDLIKLQDRIIEKRMCEIEQQDNSTAQQNGLISQNAELNEQELPSGYCLRDEYMIYAQQQSVQGLCWNFGTLMALSTTKMKATGEYLEFSDSWISNAYAHNGGYSPGAGGLFSSTVSMANKYGLVLEQDFPYDESFFLTKENKEYYFNMYGQFANQNLYDDYTTMSISTSDYKNVSKREATMAKIKNHIMNNGAVTTALSWTSYGRQVINGYEAHYKIPNTTSSGGHLVAIIGWDDNIQFTYNDTVYTGAWIAFNSYSSENIDNGENGVVYLLYDDTNYYGSFNGFIYSANTTEEIYFNTTITNSNAVYYTSLKNQYYGTMRAEICLTKQKNIFYQQDDIDITYSYEISNETAVDSIQIYSYGKNVSNLFTITNSTNENSFRIQADDLPIGAYKIVTTYSNQTLSEENLNCFYVCNGTEINFVNYEYSEGEYRNVANNGFYQHFNNLNYFQDDLVYATTLKQGTLTFKLIFASYHDVKNICVGANVFEYVNNNSSIITVDFDLNNSTQYAIKINTSNGYQRTMILNLLYQPDENSSLAYIMYDTNDSTNSSENIKRTFVSNDNTYKTEIAIPTKVGYKFEGWFTTSNFDETSQLYFENGKYYLQYDDLIQSATDTVGWSWRFSLSYKKSIVVFLYAKWAPKQMFVMSASSTLGGKISNAGNMQIYEGDNLTYHFVADEGYYLEAIYVGGLKLDAQEFENAKNNGYTLFGITNSTTIFASFAAKEIYCFTIKIGDKLETKNYYENDTIKLELPDAQNIKSVKINGEYLSSEDLQKVKENAFTLKVIDNQTIEVEYQNFDFLLVMAIIILFCLIIVAFVVSSRRKRNYCCRNL